VERDQRHALPGLDVVNCPGRKLTVGISLLPQDAQREANRRAAFGASGLSALLGACLGYSLRTWLTHSPAFITLLKRLCVTSMAR